MKHYVFAILVLAVLPVFAFPDDDPPHAIVEIPNNKMFMFDSTVNGAKVRIYLDTGGPNSKVWKDVAPKAGIAATGGRIDVAIGGIVVKDLPVSVDRANNGYTAYGMDAFFGADFARKVYTIVDYPSNKVLFVPCDGKTTYADAARIATAKLHAVEEDIVLPFQSPTGHIVVEALVNGTEKMHFIVDTGGASGNVLTGLAVKKFGIKFTKDTSETATLKVSMVGRDFGDVLFRNIRIPALEQSMSTFAKQNMTIAGVLGVDFLRKYRVGFDYGEKKVYLGIRKLSDDEKALEAAQGEFEAALKLLNAKEYDRAIAAFQKIAERFPKHEQGYTSAYNIACAYALKGEKEKAIEWLQRSVDGGYKEFDHIRKDADLDSIKDDARFKKIVGGE